MTPSNIISWLMEGDTSIQYQTHRDLLGNEKPSLRKKIALEGWGFRLMSQRNQQGSWGQDYYQPKWICTHYTLLDLKNLQIDPKNKTIRDILDKVFLNEKGPDGGILPIGGVKKSDVCVNGMALNFASYFGQNQNDLISVIDFILCQKMPDGGFNCQSNRQGADHSSLHSTLSVLEGLLEYQRNGYSYRIDEVIDAKKAAEEFIFMHRFYKSDKTGLVIHPNFLKLYYPSRWYYDILRALDYCRDGGLPYDQRMQDALDVLRNKRNKEGTWNLAAQHPGKVHFEMEKAGNPSRWNTLRALRVLKFYHQEN